MSEKIFVIGGGQWQLPIIKKAQELGYKVVCSNLHSETPGSKKADYFETADIKDREENLKIALKYSPVAVITDQSDIAVPSVAFVAEKYGLNGITSDVAKKFTDKLVMRNCVNKIVDVNPFYKEITCLDDLIEFTDVHNCPLILKPRCNQSSRGIEILNGDSDIIKSYQKCTAHATGGTIIVEEYIDGIEYTVEGFCFKNKHYSLTSSRKKHYDTNRNVASELIFPSDLTLQKRNELFEINNKLIEGFGLNFGITHSEYKIRNGQIYLIEMAARGGGSKISSDIIPLMTGIDVNELLVKCALNDDSVGSILNEIIMPCEHIQCVSLSFLNFDSGRVINRTLSTEILKINGVIDFDYLFPLHSSIDLITDDSTRHAYMIIKSDTYKNLERISRKVKAAVEIIYA